jgi:thiol-disulfide isomerase/thioredoxin
MKLLIFGKPTCPACQSIKEKMQYFSEKHAPIPIEYFDIETIDGITESAYLSVPDIPTVILMKENKEVKRWVKSAPIFSELKELLAGNKPEILNR